MLKDEVIKRLVKSPFAKSYCYRRIDNRVLDDFLIQAFYKSLRCDEFTAGANSRRNEIKIRMKFNEGQIVRSLRAEKDSPVDRSRFDLRNSPGLVSL